MLKLFVRSFTPKGIFDAKDSSRGKIVIYFIFLMLLVSFPLNLQIFRSGGWDLYNFTAGIQQSAPDWLPNQLPSDIEISRYGMYYENESVSYFETTNVNQEVLFIVFSTGLEYTITDRTLAFEPDQIVYYDDAASEVFAIGYNNIHTTVRFSELKQLTQSEAVEIFSNMIDEAFSNFAILRSVLLYTAITFGLNILLVLVVSAIFIFVRVKFQRVTTFKDNVRIVIASMTIPSMVGFIIGILELIEINAFSVVIFQFMTPLIALASIFKGAKIKDISTKGL
ncbi:MAG: DUF1189 family protein [Firmicutes bacterium]|nr:DUF1189 family protein [Bacillota bacterium]